MDQAFQAARPAWRHGLRGAGRQRLVGRRRRRWPMSTSPPRARTSSPAAAPDSRAPGDDRRESPWGGPEANGATGGGVSDFFPLPDWQAAARPALGEPRRYGGRGVPDVAGNADPATGYWSGRRGSGGDRRHERGVAAPGRARRAAQPGARPPVGFLNPLALRAPRPAVCSATSRPGRTAPSRRAPGWDACTGLGSPIGDALAAAVLA